MAFSTRPLIQSLVLFCRRCPRHPLPKTLHAARRRSREYVAHVWSCQVYLRMDHNGVSYVRCNVLQGHDHRHMWHVVRRHEGPMYHMERIQRSHKKEQRREIQLQRLHGGPCTGQLECYPNRLWQWWPKGPHGEPRAPLPPVLDYIAETIHTKAYQARHARPTQSTLQVIQRFKDDGRRRIKITCHSGLVVIFGCCFWRWHSRPKPMVGLLTLSRSLMGWLHVDGKPVIFGSFSHIKSCTDVHLDSKLYFIFSRFRDWVWKRWQTCRLATCRTPSTTSGCKNLVILATTYLLLLATMDTDKDELPHVTTALESLEENPIWSDVIMC
jgi:hypothetical protein